MTYYPDGSPAPNVSVEVRAELANKRREFESREFTSNEEGLVYFELPALPRTTQAIWIEVIKTKIR